MLPATQIKSVAVLSYHFQDREASNPPSRFFAAKFTASDFQFTIRQKVDGVSNGTAIWLSGQILSAFMLDVIRSEEKKKTKRIPRVLDLGSGTGITA